MDLTTTYLSHSLAHPFVPGAGPLADDLDQVRRLEDAGAPLITMSSLFEEEINREQVALFHHTESHAESFAEARSFFPRLDVRVGSDQYLDRLRRIKAAVGVPVVASLNGATLGGWLEHGRLLEQAGADAIELNVYLLGADPRMSAQALEARTLEMVRVVKQTVTIPVAVKLSPYYSSFAHLAAELEQAGADALVLFNRFFQPDIDVERLEVERSLHLSTSAELPLRLRWLAILSAQRSIPLAVTGGVHEPIDAMKALMAGARVVQLTSALLQRGPGYLATLRTDFIRELERLEYASLAQLRGSMNLAACPDPGAFERANYMTILRGWHPPR
jgi:dihydroorotate dehydrogenase (fumarate)